MLAIVSLFSTNFLYISKLLFLRIYQNNQFRIAKCEYNINSIKSCNDLPTHWSLTKTQTSFHHQSVLNFTLSFTYRMKFGDTLHSSNLQNN